jgi:hypothetical protein
MMEITHDGEGMLFSLPGSLSELQAGRSRHGWTTEQKEA